MAKKGRLRTERYQSVSTTVPVRIAGVNPKRASILIRSVNASGCYIGLDAAMQDSNSYFIPQNEELKIEHSDGELYALSLTTAGHVYVLEEDGE